MIERYTITGKVADIIERFSVDVPDFYQPHFNAAPTRLLPVITNTSPDGLSLFYWGIPPNWAKNKAVSEKIINLKAEALLEKPSLKKAILKRRCIIPADGFYAWKKVGKKTMIPHRFVLKDKSLFSFAGIWEDFEDEEGDENHTFMIITCPSNGIVAAATPTMPIILNKASEKIWLSNEAEDNLVKVLTPIDATALECYTVSPVINTDSVDFPSLINHVPPSDQHGNLTLFD